MTIPVFLLYHRCRESKLKYMYRGEFNECVSTCSRKQYEYELSVCSVTNCCFVRLWEVDSNRHKGLLRQAFLVKQQMKSWAQHHKHVLRDLYMWRNLRWAVSQTERKWAILVEEARLMPGCWCFGQLCVHLCVFGLVCGEKLTQLASATLDEAHFGNCIVL